MSIAVRRASRELIGPWYYLDPRNPSGRGVTFETLIKMIEKGRIKVDSIVRGPPTHQDWMYAAEAPRLAKYLGMCPHCFGEVRPEDTFCTHCQLNMNTRPAEPRPGIPANLVKPPFHKAAYELEEQLVTSATPSAATLEGQSLDVPGVMAPPSPPPMARAEPTPSPRPVMRPEPAHGSRSAAAAMAAATAGGASPVDAMAGAATAVAERPMRSAATRRPRPKWWVVLLLTWASLGVLFGGLWLAGFNPFSGRADVGDKGGKPGDATHAKTVDDTDAQRQFDRAMADKDYVRAQRVSLEVFNRTGDLLWKNRLAEANTRLAEIEARAKETATARTDRLKKVLEQADKLADGHQYDESLRLLAGISQDDRAFLKTRYVEVDPIVQNIAEAQRRRKQQEDEVKGAVGRAAQMRTAKKLDEALKTLKDVKANYPADLVKIVAPNLDQDIQALETQLAAVKPPPIKVDPIKPDPPKELTAEQAAAIIADLKGRADQLEKNDKLAEALAQLEEIQKRVDKKFWPEGLEDRIRVLRKKVEALNFFLGDPGAKPKTP
jgi:hypothetical protein